MRNVLTPIPAPTSHQHLVSLDLSQLIEYRSRGCLSPTPHSSFSGMPDLPDQGTKVIYKPKKAMNSEHSLLSQVSLCALCTNYVHMRLQMRTLAWIQIT